MVDQRRPLTARSVIASTLLGTDPPVLPASSLVRTGALFGLAEGTVRTALSRMATAGELLSDGNGHYELTGALIERQDRQRTSRAAPTHPWNGNWVMAVVASGARNPTERADLRLSMQRRRFAELRDGVWVRPDNLEHRADPIDGSCDWFSADLGLPSGTAPGDDGDGDPAALAARLWDLGGWADAAEVLRTEMAGLVDRFDGGDATALARGFVVSAAVLRHLGTDPLLPLELLPQDWPGGPLRSEYDRYDDAYRRSLGVWIKAG